MTDEQYMHLALKLAAKGRCYASPNPMVGAVIVKNGRIIGRGYHQCCGQNHAEVNAIEDAKENVAGSTLYVTLEPCCHSGKTPPCTDLIIRHNIRRVVIAAADSNPLVSCRGIACLESAGIEVTRGVLETESRSLNEVFFHFMETGMPFVTVKYAQTLDGRIATATGNSQWISSPGSLKFAHRLRAEHDAVLVGIGTVLQDNPTLTVRLVRGRNPLRVVVDSGLATPFTANVLRNLSEAPTRIATTKKPSDPRYRALSEAGARLMTVAPDREGHVDLKKLFRKLAAENISSVLIEGGAGIITSALREGLARRLVVVTAPKIIGKGIEAVGDLNIRDLKDAKPLSVRKIFKKGPDVIMDARL
ncbi:MAG TPA: bifunctional diaminohydroxyphosphoribosylaminopyrimidine deaminase/5-amino-6-(5-phosphoribosylamino)uracil reductase RibD [Smithellaceae bacterium]|jgi:diaminohydroxyphosphoribosylaminopyrimidine deaminase/5-amino-6-(5-phosphoribosylamino)uracil reductase|nr:bifunctional diaminohydroxyphosphoribosylaminopyrimidine deaminase/5-amino-6-(5-phosphoribosylamino)uracil reductase RibD [Smithellaceae bacterium]HOE23772.1 bifunctional diaminohydroxyphosphoribosylaminopyrimidine deaminase/5-amino-6-(5-phosphoribosylamino)uracil reductase RibD [Smithellaceae bacterium]HOU55565.1 bifunctional diaminohydroxyphosphoribosylaminopyrimidine deaminase/5-amino-6-(5-phosphoribosylamino)uracil reductase RibD [Smithellaceae bacterium]HPL32780.1 bifunctional diaminohyd